MVLESGTESLDRREKEKRIVNRKSILFFWESAVFQAACVAWGWR